MFTEHVASRSPRCAFEGAEAPCVLVDPLERDRVVVLEVLDLLEELAREGRQVGGQLVALALQRGAALAQLRLSLSLSLSLSCEYGSAFRLVISLSPVCILPAFATARFA